MEENKEFVTHNDKKIKYCANSIQNINSEKIRNLRTKELKDAIEKQSVKDLILTSLRSTYDSKVIGKFDVSEYQEA